MHFFLEHWRSFFEMVWHNQPVLEHQNGIYFPSSLHPENEPQVHLAKDIRFFHGFFFNHFGGCWTIDRGQPPHWQTWGHRDSTASAKGGSIGFSHSGCGERSVMAWWVNHDRVQNQKANLSCHGFVVFWNTSGSMVVFVAYVLWVISRCLYKSLADMTDSNSAPGNHGRLQTMAENQPTKTTRGSTLHPPSWMISTRSSTHGLGRCCAVTQYTGPRGGGFTTCRRRMGMVISVGGDGDDMLKKNLLALFSFTEFPWTSCECPMMKLISLSHPEIWRKSGFKYHSPTEISNLTFTHFVGETCDNISGSSHLGGS